MLLKEHRNECTKLFKMILNIDNITGPYNVCPFQLFQSEITFKFKQNTSAQNGEDFKCVRNDFVITQHMNPCRKFDDNRAKQNNGLPFTENLFFVLAKSTAINSFSPISSPVCCICDGS